MTNHQKIIEELWYEVIMFNSMAERILLPENFDDYGSFLATNAFYESFLIHTRNLVSFLEDKKFEAKDGSKDIICSDFGVKAQKVSLPSGYGLREINKFQQHLTQERIKSESPEWKKKVPNILYEVNQCFKNFIKKLPQEYFPGKISASKFDRVFDRTEILMNHFRNGKSVDGS